MVYCLCVEIPCLRCHRAEAAKEIQPGSSKTFQNIARNVVRDNIIGLCLSPIASQENNLIIQATLVQSDKQMEAQRKVYSALLNKSLRMHINTMVEQEYGS